MAGGASGAPDGLADSTSQSDSPCTLVPHRTSRGFLRRFLLLRRPGFGLLGLSTVLCLSGIRPSPHGKEDEWVPAAAAESLPIAFAAGERVEALELDGFLAPRPLEAASSNGSSAEAALDALSRHVVRASHSDALFVAFQAYYNYRQANPALVQRPYLYFVDLGLDNRTARGYVFDMEALTLVEGPFTVSHGRGSSSVRDGVPTSFSNRAGSNASSLGLYLAQETYTFGGRSGGRAYHSVGLRMRGESGEFNNAARARGIVAHGAPYVSGSAAGRSEGCPAMELERAQRLLPLLANGGVVFLYSPHEARWLREDPWAARSRVSNE